MSLSGKLYVTVGKAVCYCRESCMLLSGEKILSRNLTRFSGGEKFQYS